MQKVKVQDKVGIKLKVKDKKKLDVYNVKENRRHKIKIKVCI